MSVPSPRDADGATPSQEVAPIPLVDLKAAHEEIADAVRVGFDRVLGNSAFILGPEVEAFEAEFAGFTGTRHCIGLSSGTDALELALRAAGIEAGDEVLLPANTFIATALAVVRAGASPVLVDCDAEHHLLDPLDLEQRITERARAILPVHLYGQCAPMEQIQAVADAHGLIVIEDCAQAQGAKRNGRSAGTLSAMGATSFYPGKNLGAYGDAGAIVTDDERLADSLRALRNYGSTKKYEHPEIGFNCRLDALQAVVLRAKLTKLADGNARRRQAAGIYGELLSGLDGVRPVATLEGNEHVHHLFVVEIEAGAAERDRILTELQRADIGAGIHYPKPLHLNGAFRGLGQSRGNFPVAERACERVLSLPIFPQLTQEQQERVVQVLERALLRR